ncbi:MAG: helix-turn-helix transcriptional regulator [Lachnospiraceae bacterium]|nr:helix-turn-helix transcriptional regulator [Lachnospiraceae bacterium]
MNPKLKEAAVHGSKEYPFAVYDLQKIGPSFHVSLHWHEELEIVYVYEGPLYLTIENQDYIGHSGDIFLVNSKEIHKMHVQDMNVRYGTLLFPLNSLLFQETDESTRKYLQPLYTGDMMFAHTIDNLELSGKIFSIITEIVRLNKEKVPAYRFGTKALLLQILFLLFNYHMELSSHKSHKNSTLNRDIISYISEHYTGDLTLAEIADNFHMSYKYFSRYFKNTFNTTLSDYIMKLRLERAELLLSQSELSITEISLQTGFNNISFFIRSFKKAYGMTPLKYRNHQGIFQD